MPLGTIEAVLDHRVGRRATIEEGIQDAHRTMAKLAQFGIDFAVAARQLQDEGVAKFIGVRRDDTPASRRSVADRAARAVNR